jgi:hypothetical protein
MSDKQTIVRGRIRVELDRDEVYPDDPGRGTPALVHIGKNCGTYWCVRDTGELMDGPALTAAECKWLWDIEDDVEGFLYTHLEDD